MNHWPHSIGLTGLRRAIHINRLLGTKNGLAAGGGASKPGVEALSRGLLSGLHRPPEVYVSG